MTAPTTQISASISRETKKLLDAYVRRRGVKKSWVIEQALRHHLLAVNEIPEEYIIPPVIRVTKESAELIAAMLEKSPTPTPAMRNLMGGK
jgi:hypothetical protein